MLLMEQTRMTSSLLGLSHRYILSNTLVRSLTRPPTTASISKWFSTLRLGSSQMLNRVLLESNTLLVTLVASSTGSSVLQIGQVKVPSDLYLRENSLICWVLKWWWYTFLFLELQRGQRLSLCLLSFCSSRILVMSPGRITLGLMSVTGWPAGR